ncbi:MAG: general secretion pathway protein GspK [Candidatus Methylomirabilia bacterium]
MTGERGFALLAVMLVLALLGVVVTEFAYSMRLEATMVRSYKEDLIGLHLAEAAVEQAIREILTDASLVGFAEEEPLLTFFTGPTEPLPRMPRSDVRLGPGQFAYRITDEEGRLNLNMARPDQIDQLLRDLGLDKELRDIVNDSLQDWKDSNDAYRLNGAESEDTYLELPVPYRARNGPLEAVAELLQIKGVTAALYSGSTDEPGLAEFVTVWGQGQVNINTAPEPVLKALGLSEAEVSDIVQSRQSAPYAAVPPRFAGRGLSAASRTFRVEAEGWVGDGAVRVRVVAIVQPTSEEDADEPAATILSWNPNPVARP